MAKKNLLVTEGEKNCNRGKAHGVAAAIAATGDASQKYSCSQLYHVVVSSLNIVCRFFY